MRSAPTKGICKKLISQGILEKMRSNLLRIFNCTHAKRLPNLRKNNWKVHFRSVDSKTKPISDGYMYIICTLVLLIMQYPKNYVGQVQNFGWDHQMASTKICITENISVLRIIYNFLLIILSVLPNPSSVLPHWLFKSALKLNGNFEAHWKGRWFVYHACIDTALCLNIWIPHFSWVRVFSDFYAYLIITLFLSFLQCLRKVWSHCDASSVILGSFSFGKRFL